MLHTSMYGLNQAIKKISLAEIKNALIVNGGEYVWENASNAPIVVVNNDWMGTVEAYITRLYIGKHKIMVEAMDKEENEVDIDIDDIEECHLEYLVEYMTPRSFNAKIPGVQLLIDKFCKDITDYLKANDYDEEV